MYGDSMPFKVKQLLQDVEMNALEIGLLDKYLNNFDNI